MLKFFVNVSIFDKRQSNLIIFLYLNKEVNFVNNIFLNVNAMLIIFKMLVYLYIL